MQLVELMVAASLFAGAISGSLQLWSDAAATSQRLDHRQLLLERIELDRLQLMAQWRRHAVSSQLCPGDPDALVQSAAHLPPPPQLQRFLERQPNGPGVKVRWSVASDPTLQRQRLFTAAGLGLCRAVPLTTASAFAEAT